MTPRRSTRYTALLATVTALLMAGCETGFIADAARSNLASFAIDVFTAAVNESINSNP